MRPRQQLTASTSKKTGCEQTLSAVIYKLEKAAREAKVFVRRQEDEYDVETAVIYSNLMLMTNRGGRNAAPPSTEMFRRSTC